MELRRRADYRRMPWKNGGGMTAEIAVFPEGAGIAGFGWRISMAEVGADGPFSAFPGIDRTLTVIDGAGIDLDFGDGTPPLRATQAGGPVSFAGDRPAAGRLIAGPITDLNVMTRRGAFRHHVRRLAIDRPADVAAGGIATLLVPLGAAGIRSNRLAITAEAFDSVLITNDARIVPLGAGTALDCLVITIAADGSGE